MKPIYSGRIISVALYRIADNKSQMKIVVIALLIVFGLSWDLPWVKPADLNRGLPSSIEIYTLNTTDTPFGTKLTGGYAKFNMNDTNLEFIVRDTNGDALGYFPKTPMEYAATEENVVYAVINGGYFDMTKNISASFLAEKGKVKTPNGINSGANVHPTVGAFGITAEAKFETEYIYSYGPDFETYKFSRPNHFPGPAPIRDDGLRWDVREGIGAGPILLKKTSIIENNVENFNKANMIDFRHPRSAICVDLANNLYFVAIDGRYSGSDGLSMPELAQLMQSIHCWDAMNLDGGGSTLLFANNKVINRPSDASGPRPVVSAVLIRDRYKKKIINLSEE